MDARVRQFLEANHAGVMVTIRRDGRPHAVRCSLALVDGRLWSSGTRTRVRTRHLRRDPRATLLVISNESAYAWLGLDAHVTLREGPSAVDENLALYRILRGADPENMDAYRASMVSQQRLIYEFAIDRAYGLK